MTLPRYVWKSFRKGLGKGLFFAFVLAVTLVLAILNLMTSMQQSLYREAVSVNGDAHVKYQNITEEQIENMSADGSVKWAERQYQLSSVWGEPDDRWDYGINFVHSSRMGETVGFRLTDGRAPAAENEAALPPHVAEALGISAKVGETFELPLSGNADGLTAQMVVTGVMEQQDFYETADTNMLFVSKAFVDRYAELGTMWEEYGPVIDSLYLHFQDGYPPEETAYSLAQQQGVSEKDVLVNTWYINAMVQDPMLMGLLALAIGLLILMGALVIYNIFNIMVIKRVQEYGMLTLVGASRKQIRRCVFLESLLYVLISLPVGYLLGTLLSLVCMPVLQNIMDTVRLEFSISAWSYAATAGLIALMALIGAARPAHKAAAIAPVEAVKFSVKMKPVKRKRQEENITLPVLAKLNRGRNRGRINVTVLTLSISGILFLSIATLGATWLDNVESSIRHDMDADIYVMTGERHGSSTSYNPTMDALTEPVLEEIRSIDGVEEIKPYWMTAYVQEAGDDYMANGAVITGADEELEDLRDPQSTVAIVNRTCPYSAEYLCDAGDTITVYPFSYSDGKTGSPFTLRVIGVIDVANADFNRHVYYNNNLPDLLLGRETYQAHGLKEKYETVSVYVEEDKQEQAAQAIHSLCEKTGGLYYHSAFEMVQERMRQVMGSILLVGAMIVIIAFIGVLNLISTTYVGIEQRRREFGVLSALGLSVKGIKRVLLRENMWVSLMSIAISTVLGLGSGFVMYRLFYSSGVNFLEYSFPLLPVLLLCTVLLLVPLITTKVAVRRLFQSPAAQLLSEDT